MIDKLVESLRRRREFSNTIRKTKWYDGIDLTMNQSFKEETEEVYKPENYWIHIDDGIPNFIMNRNERSQTDILENSYKEINRFFLNDDEEDEQHWREKYGCECCGSKLIFPHEKLWGLCFECDRKMFTGKRVKDIFPGLPDYCTCISEELYIPQNKITRMNEGSLSGWKSWLNKYILRRQKIQEQEHTGSKRKYPFFKIIG